MEDLPLQIWRGSVLLQRKQRFIALFQGLPPGQTSPAISYTEGLALHVIEMQSGKTVKELAEVLKLERSWVSRIVFALEERKLIRSTTPDYDKRAKALTLTTRGKEHIRHLNESRRKIVLEAVKDLSSSEQDELCRYSKLFADGLETPAQFASEGIHPLDAELARISLGIGVAGENFMGTCLSVTQYQVLLEVAQAGKAGVSASELFEVLPFDMSTISRTLGGFVEDGLIEKQESAQDRRTLQVTLRPEGAKRWKEITKNIGREMQKALSWVSEAQCRRYQRLLEKAVTDMPRRSRGLTRARVEVEPADGKDTELASLVETVSEASRSAGRAAKRFAVKVNGTTRGVLELIEDQAGGKRHMLFALHELGEKEFLQAAKACMREVMTRGEEE